MFNSMHFELLPASENFFYSWFYHHSEFCRSELQLHNLGDQLGMDAIGVGNNEEDSSVNIVSDGEPTGNYVASPKSM